MEGIVVIERVTKAKVATTVLLQNLASTLGLIGMLLGEKTGIPIHRHRCRLAVQRCGDWQNALFATLSSWPLSNACLRVTMALMSSRPAGIPLLTDKRGPGQVNWPELPNIRFQKKIQPAGVRLFG